MAMAERDRFDHLLALLEDLAEENESRPIVVEGQRDVTSLRAMGCRGEVLPLHSGETLFALAERLSASFRDVILLTDWDRKGDALFEQLGASLGACGVRCDRTYRDRLREATQSALKDVEGLAGYVSTRLARRHHEGVGTRFAPGEARA